MATSLRRGGAETVIAHLAKGLHERGDRPTVICLEEKGQLAEELEAGGIQVMALGSLRGYDWRAAFRLRRLLRQVQPRVINTHDRASLPYLMFANALGVRRPVVFSAHGFLYRDSAKPRLRYRLPARFLAGMTAETEQVAARYTQHLGWSGPVDLIPNGVLVTDTSAPHRRQARLQVGLPEDAFVFLSVGNIRPEKGFENLLAAARRLRDAGTVRPFVCLVAGTVADEKYHAGLMAEHHDGRLDGVVRFLGFQADLEPLYRSADALVLPSHSEGIPMVLLEGMMHGLPVIVTRVGGMPAVVRGPVGVLVEPRSPDLLADAMARFLTEPGLAVALGNNARERALDEYTVDRMVSRYLAVFDRVVSRASGGRNG